MLADDLFSDYYHKLSNVETTFHMLNTKSGDSVNAKKERSQFNETLH